jgi:hypothetical protein
MGTVVGVKSSDLSQKIIATLRGESLINQFVFPPISFFQQKLPSVFKIGARQFMTWCSACAHSKAFGMLHCHCATVDYQIIHNRYTSLTPGIG